MKIINVILITLIIMVYTLAFIACGRPIYAAPADDETETETELPYSNDDFYELSHVIQGQAGYCSWDMMIGVGSVVLNRVASDKFPNTIYQVIHQTSPTVQYTCDMSAEPTEQALQVTDYLLRNGSQYPSDVLYQANSTQGPIYQTLDSGYSTMYFCYG